MNWVTFISALVAAAASIGALIVSIKSLRLAKRQGYAGIIASRRVEWMESLRKELKEYVTVYMDECREPVHKRKRLLAQHFYILSFMNTNKVFTYNADLKAELDAMLYSPVDEPIEDFSNLLTVSQLVLNLAYRKAKRESGGSFDEDELRHQMTWFEKNHINPSDNTDQPTHWPEAEAPAPRE